MFHGKVDAKVELDPGKRRVIVPEDFQNSTGQGPVPTCGGSSALDRDLYPKLFDDSITRKSNLVSLFNVPNVSVD